MIHWEENERKAWLAFLNTPEGQQGLAYLRERKLPVIRSAGAPHEMHMDLGAHKGFHHALEEIEKLGRIPEEKTPKTADRPSLAPTRRP